MKYLHIGEHLNILMNRNCNFNENNLYITNIFCSQDWALYLFEQILDYSNILRAEEKMKKSVSKIL